MPDEYYIKEFEDYIEQLCREHVDVLHETNAKICFSRLRSRTEVTEIINNAGENIVIMGRFNGRSVGDSQEQTFRQFVVLRFACYAINNGVDDPSDGIDNAIQKAQDIMFQFISRFRKDQKDDDCGPLRLVELQNISWDEIDEPIYLENHYGWDLTLQYKSYFPAYDAAKWT